MSFTYDWNNPTLSQLRLMVGDTDPTPPGPFFQDEEITGVLNLFNAQAVIIGLTGYAPAIPPPGNVYSFGRAAAMLLNGLGAVRARNLVSKVLDVDMAPAAAAAALTKLGQQYIDQEISSGFFSVAEMVQDSFSMRERLRKMLYRQSN